MWFIFVIYFCSPGVCNDNIQLGPNFSSYKSCIKARDDLAAGRATFFTNDEGSRIPLSATSCRQRPEVTGNNNTVENNVILSDRPLVRGNNNTVSGNIIIPAGN